MYTYINQQPVFAQIYILLQILVVERRSCPYIVHKDTEVCRTGADVDTSPSICPVKEETRWAAD